MKKHDPLIEQKTALFQQLDAVVCETWTDADQTAIERNLADLDAGKGIAWEDFRKKFARYAM